ncbi:hypothetical protein Tco_1163946 [Tanacetum coccineum]
MNLRFLEDKPNVQGIGHEWYFDLDYLTDSLGYTRHKTDKPAGTQETNIPAGTQDQDSDSDVDEQVIVVPSFPSNSFAAGNWILLWWCICWKYTSALEWFPTAGRLILLVLFISTCCSYDPLLRQTLLAVHLLPLLLDFIPFMLEEFYTLTSCYPFLLDALFSASSYGLSATGSGIMLVGHTSCCGFVSAEVCVPAVCSFHSDCFLFDSFQLARIHSMQLRSRLSCPLQSINADELVLCG